MYSEALAVLDKNTELYMIDKMEKTLKKKDAIIAKKEAVISEKNAELSEKNNEIVHLRAKLAMYENLDEE